MAKSKYNPLQAIPTDPLAALKKLTVDQSRVPSGLEGRAFAEAALAGPLEESKVREEKGQDALRMSRAPVKPLSSTSKPSRNTIYLYPEDLTKLRQLSGYASTEHGVRANDSMILRAALSLIEPDVRFFHALRESELSDRRRATRNRPTEVAAEQAG